jgi:CRISPR-associated endonuclease/helicase Cas3
MVSVTHATIHFAVENQMTLFWAKTTLENQPGISVYEHLINVGCVARCIAELFPESLKRFHLRPKEVSALAALHDIGKISPGFQQKCKAWLEENGFVDIARNGCWDTVMESNHGVVSHSAIQDFLLQQGISRDRAQYLSAILGAHHGRINHTPNPRGIKPPFIKQLTENKSGIEWHEERQKTAQKIWNYFDADNSAITFYPESPALWWLAGLTTLADWIGSDERFFPAEHRAENNDVPFLAMNALEAIGFRKIQFFGNLSFHDLFHDAKKPEVTWVPNAMQEKTLSIVNAPGVYVIEAPMGTGKTEAALWAAYQLLVSNKAVGIYFALPTQVTSNRIHLRMNAFLQRICQVKTPNRLIHSNSWLVETDIELHPATTERLNTKSEDVRDGRDWFTSTKRALIAPFGVGTVDQALLGVVAAKHFFIRHFALAGKVVIIDEVHSYDLFTGTLIDKLITTLEELGCIVIVLSATLSGKRRRQIIPLTDDVEIELQLSYPLITGRREGGCLEPAAITPPKSRDVRVDFVTNEQAINEAISLAKKRGTVLWISNTIDVAQDQYRQFMKQAHGEIPIGLLHSRFPFWRREQLEDEWMERFGKNGEARCGSVLVSTQVVEQSVDLDADLLITELAPTDMLLQRLGRLWRHERQRPIEFARICILQESKSLDELRQMGPKAILKALGGKAHVYAPFVLLRSLEIWEKQSKKSTGVSIPSQIRRLIEATYEERESDPESWQQLRTEWTGTDLAKRVLANRNTNFWQVALEDEEGLQTRLNEIPTVSLVLCRSLTRKEAVFIDHSRGLLGSDQYLLATTQAIHKNLVKVPEYSFDHIELNPAFSDYLKGRQCVGIVGENGMIEVKGLKNGIRFFYSDAFGLVIERSSNEEEI